MYKALYRKYRSKDFDDLCGQDHISSVLRIQASTQNISHAYLFCGTRGTGKTSTAKILAKAVNCTDLRDGNPCNECPSCREIDSESSTDVLEIDAASNNGVNNIRDLRDEVTYPPSVLKKRVYIIDEVHMLTDAAFNALLKTLEEPPEYVVFILCTTELNKIPPTILSRCQRYDFRRIDRDVIKSRLLYIAEKENFKLEEDAAEVLSRLADGSLRDAINLLDSCISGNKNLTVDIPLIERQLGVSNRELLLRMFEHIIGGDIAGSLKTLSAVHESSVNLIVFLEDMLTLTRDILIAQSTGRSDYTSFVFTPEENLRFEAFTHSISSSKLLKYASVLEDIYYKTGKYSENIKLTFEIALIELCKISTSPSYDELYERVEALERAQSVMHAAVPTIAEAPSKPVRKLSESDGQQQHADEKKPSPNEENPEPILEKNSAPSMRYAKAAALIDAVKSNRSVWAVLKGCTFTQNDKILNIHCDSFAKDILSQRSASELIESSASTLSGHPIKIRFIVKGGAEKESHDLIDEIIPPEDK